MYFNCNKFGYFKQIIRCQKSLVKRAKVKSNILKLYLYWQHKQK